MSSSLVTDLRFYLIKGTELEPLRGVRMPLRWVEKVSLKFRFCSKTLSEQTSALHLPRLKEYNQTPTVVRNNT